MNLLLISISLIVLSAIIYISFHRKSTAKKEKKVINKTSESKQKLKQGESIKSSTKPEPLAEHDFELKSSLEEPVESISYTTTTGENEFYKAKLKDPRWIELSKKIKARDHNRCVECGSDGGEIIILNSIEELKPLVDFPEVYEAVKEIYDNRLLFNFNSIEQRFSGYIHGFSDIYDFVSRNSIYQLQDKYLYTFVSNTSVLNKNIIKFISNTLKVDRVQCNIIKFEKYLRYFKADRITSITLSMGLLYIIEGHTDNQLILRQSEYEYDTNIVVFGGQGILTYNGLSIIFPLYSLGKKKSLDVHHTVYYLDKEPWDFEEPYSELTTLCHKCHMEAHKHPIPVKSRNSTGTA